MKSTFSYSKNQWGLILGASSGFGAATARELARHGMSIIGVHFDRAAGMPAVEALIEELQGYGVHVRFFNVNASDPQKRAEVLDTMKEEFGSDSANTIRVLMHSLAFGSLKPLVSPKSGVSLTQAQIEMTMDVMANSLVYWTQAVMERGLMKRGGRVYAMTSSGGHSSLLNYGAVSAAKAALESYIRQISLELGPLGITANTILGGVTDTPALKKIPGASEMLEVARARNPSMRNCTPEDVAKAIALLAHDDAHFISGNVIRVDGGEDYVQYIGKKSVERPD
ncbi:MAG: SDR family oxidoreductase [Bacteroidetes bacterium]|nr:SDR family oxidoreductase [Bacteroidota bacterium]MCW5894345.1 SDR family oxidoreductase [Bacteroidota bacterium]